MNIDRIPIDKDEVMFPSPEDMAYERWRDSLNEEMQNAIDEGDITEIEVSYMSLMEQEEWLNEQAPSRKRIIQKERRCKKMNKFLITLSYEEEIEAEDWEEAKEKFFKNIEGTPQQTLATFLDDNLIIKQIL